MHARTFKSGAHLIDPSRPGWIDDLLEFHRAAFGAATMRSGTPGAGGDGTGGEGGGDGSGDGGAGSSGGSGDGTDGEPKLNEHGFPDRTPWKEMKPEHQAAYWRHQARRHESHANARADYDDVKAERDRLKAASLSDDEKAAEEARTKAADAARAEERAKLAPKLVAAEFKSAGAGKIPAAQLASLIAGAHAPNFLASDGEVDTDKVTEFLEPFMTDGDGDSNGSKKWPDMGQGRRQDKKSSGVGAGRDLYADRRAKK